MKSDKLVELKFYICYNYNMIKNTLTFLTGLLSGFSDDIVRQTLLNMQKSVDYLQEENKILRQQLREKYNCKRLRLTDLQKRRLSAKAFEIGKKGLMNLTTVFSLQLCLVGIAN